VLGLVGDNGAGKSTLLKILSGVLPADSGEIFLEGREIQIRRAQDAMEAGIETVYQDLALVDTMAAYQNVYLGREQLARSWLPRVLNLVDDREMRRRSREVLEALAVKIPSINVTVKGMSGGQRQCLAIARAILWGRRIVILDEPTAALGVRESRAVLDLIARLRGDGRAVIVISHALDHVIEIADRAVVLRRGRVVGEVVPTAENHQQIVSLIVGGGR
jgi:ABC-type sugar transport system ATPase subunit